jgi:hypothetical protein
MRYEELLFAVHKLRQEAHWGKVANLWPWPITDKEWRQTPHGSPLDTNVEMAMFHFKLAQRIKDEGLLK